MIKPPENSSGIHKVQTPGVFAWGLDVLLQILLGGNGAVATNTIEGIRRLCKSCGHRSFVKLCETPDQARKAL
jgi:hypothetical protein